MANTLTDLIPDLYQALDVVSREMVGFIPAVARNSSAERAAKDETIRIPITPAATVVDNTPAVTSPDSGDQTIGNSTITISRSKSATIRWNGEQQKGMQNAGTYSSVLGQQFEQGFRSLVNLMETDLYTAAYQGASRAYGTAGTAPFGTAGDLSDVAQLRKILDDNGAPQSDLHLVLGSAAVANLRGKQTILLKTNENGDSAFRKTGAVADIPLDGFMLHNSNSIAAVTKGTGTGYLANGAVAAGVNSVVLDTGSGTVLAGDVVTFNGDTNKYVVNTALAANTITIGTPGLLAALADNTAMTVGNNYTPNVGFHRNAIQFVTRAPALPVDQSGRPVDAADDAMIITDPVTGISFEITVYRQFKQVLYMVGAAWGWGVVRANHIATLIG